MLTRSLVLSLFVALLTACATTDSCIEDLTGDNFSVTLKKGACLGKCPVYNGTVYGDATVLFEGRMNVDRLGRHSGSISAKDLCAIKTMVDEMDFMNLAEDQTKPVMDAPQTSITVVMDDVQHTVKWNIGAPEHLAGLAAAVSEATLENETLVEVASDQ